MSQGTSHGKRSLSVTEVVGAAPQRIFTLLATPARHAELDGSGMLRGRPQGPDLLTGPGDRFSMGMSQRGIAYRSVNVVVEYEKDRLLTWETWGEVGGRRLVGGQRWRYELEPEGTSSTRVTHTYDWSRARFPRLVVELSGFPRRMGTAMTATLGQLAALTGRL
ncbi:SRPBCC family protein [Streptomyces sp. NPDC055287]